MAIHAYAVMSNHLHIVLQMDASTTAAWSDEEVALRWERLFPLSEYTDAARDRKREALLADPGRLSLLRERLGSLSWLMRCLAEPIARRANREDQCSGRFWEGRFRCQVLCDERSLLAAMAYVDLNPIRAGMTDTLDASVHTSVSERIGCADSVLSLAAPLRPVAGLLSAALSVSMADYLQILDWTGRSLAPRKRGRVAGPAPAVLSTIDRDAKRWAERVRGYGRGWWRVVGRAQDLIELARRIGQRWLQGVRLAWLLD